MFVNTVSMKFEHFLIFVSLWRIYEIVLFWQDYIINSSFFGYTLVITILKNGPKLNSTLFNVIGIKKKLKVRIVSLWHLCFTGALFWPTKKD